MAKIDSVDGRTRLKPRDEPYWVRLAAGCYLGYRKLTSASTGTWIARFRNSETGARTKRSLGDLESVAPSKRYDAAKSAAEEWFRHLGRGGSTEVLTVEQVCRNYVSHVRSTRGDTAARDIHARFERWVYGQPLSALELGKLGRSRLEAWRTALAQTPARIDRGTKGRRMRPRSEGTLNRDMTALRAALNHAYDAGHTTSDTAWRVALRPNRNVDRPRDVYLDIHQRRSLVRHAPADLAAFLRGLSLVPLRPGALAGLHVGNYDRGLGVLTIGRDKAGRDRKIKLPPETADFFSSMARDKLPGAPLLSRADGKSWDKDSWKWPVKAAAAAAGLPSSTTAYVVRHSVITDLVVGGLDLATTALLSGTSATMIERHYMHLRADRAADALATLAL